MPAVGDRDYRQKRRFDETPEPEPDVSGDVDPTTAKPGPRFVIHQHHATRLHFDLRLEMLNGRTPVLVSWAVPKNLPFTKGKSHLAIHVEDHPFEYGTFSGSIPKGNYGAGEVRIFDEGEYEMLEQGTGRLKFRLRGRRMRAVYTLSKWNKSGEKDNWLAFLSTDEREPAEPPPNLVPMLAQPCTELASGEGWLFEPLWEGKRVLARCSDRTELSEPVAAAETFAKLHQRLVSTDAVLDGVVVQSGKSLAFVVFDVIYMDGKNLSELPLDERKRILQAMVVPDPTLAVSVFATGDPTHLVETIKSQGLGGVIAKRRDSLYKAGPSGDWLMWVDSS